MKLILTLLENTQIGKLNIGLNRTLLPQPSVIQHNTGVKGNIIICKTNARETYRSYSKKKLINNVFPD